jgi:serine/threonine-protein kinase RsbW
VSDPIQELAVLQISTAPEEIESLHPWLAAQAETLNLSKTQLNGMQVALEEVVMNVAMHGVAQLGCGEVTVRFGRAPDAVVLVVEDDGQAFDPVAAAPRKRPESLREAEVGGLGLTLLRHYCRDIHYERAGDRNRLTMRFPA